MCVSPITIDSGETVACRNCWQCRENRVNDLVGRCLAERQTASEALAVTLTYRGDTPHAHTLVYSDVQKFLKVLRKRYSVRYIVAGEYGSKNGRAHWHCVLFFHGDAPRIVDHPDDRMPYEVILPRWKSDARARIQWAPWSHGFAYFQQANYQGFRYLLKYALKDAKQDVQLRKPAMSKKPPLGHWYFQDLAAQYVERGLAPQSFDYAFSNETKESGRLRHFHIQGKTRQNFMESFLNGWREKYGSAHPISECVDAYENSLVDLDLERTEDEWRLLYQPTRPAFDYLAEDRPDRSRDQYGTIHGLPCHAQHWADRKGMTLKWLNRDGTTAHWAPEGALLDHAKRLFRPAAGSQSDIIRRSLSDAMS